MEIFNAYRHHAAGQRVHTVSALASAIAAEYPDYCIVATTHDLIKFANNTGQASADLVQEGPPSLFLREYNSTLRVTNDDDLHTLLQTSIIFAHYKYTWSDNEYLVFVAEGQDSLTPIVTPGCGRRSYILSKPAEGEMAGKSISKAADELILAAGIFAENSNDEVWVFDQGSWKKDKSLWVGTQGANFDSIVMPGDMKESILRDVDGFFDGKEYYREFGTPWKVMKKIQVAFRDLPFNFLV
jgi:transitional endoplasmic reticulum ATPase